MTFSIVAIDREANAVGLAIVSCCWDAGPVNPRLRGTLEIAAKKGHFPPELLAAALGATETL